MNAASFVPLTCRPTLAACVLSSDPQQQQGLHQLLSNLAAKADGREWILPTRKRKCDQTKVKHKKHKEKKTEKKAKEEKAMTPKKKARKTTKASSTAAPAPATKQPSVAQATAQPSVCTIAQLESTTAREALQPTTPEVPLGAVVVSPSAESTFSVISPHAENVSLGWSENDASSLCVSPLEEVSPSGVSSDEVAFYALEPPVPVQSQSDFQRRGSLAFFEEREYEQSIEQNRRSSIDYFNQRELPLSPQPLNLYFDDFGPWDNTLLLQELQNDEQDWSQFLSHELY